MNSDIPGAALDFQNVHKVFGSFTAIEDISFSVQKGEFFALLGQNGAGKTTLINCLSGVSSRTSGKILVEGFDPEKNPEITKQKLGIVEQEIVIDPFFSPFEALQLVRGYFGKPKNDAYLEWLLQKLHLSEKKNASPFSLSGGMKRRLMIARALAHEPEILILDEPTAGVDIELRQNLWKFLQELRTEKNITILLTTHYLEEAEMLADRIAIIHQGKTLVCADKKDLLQHKKRKLEVDFENAPTQIFEIESNSEISEIIGSLQNISDIRILEPKLEEIFLEYTKTN